MDRHGYFSLGTNCDYVAPFIGQVPFFLEVNHRMPRTFGRNQIHRSQVAGCVEVDRPLVEVRRAGTVGGRSSRIAAHVAERIPDGATIQAGIGSIPSALLDGLRGHRDLGVHTELLSDGLIDLVERGVVTGTRKRLEPGKVVTTFALGSQALYDFLDENPAVEFLPVDYVNDPRVIAQEDELRVDQRDDRGRPPRPVRVGDGRRPLLVLERRAGRLRPGRDVLGEGRGLRRRCPPPRWAARSPASAPTLTPGSVVTTLKNTVDHIVTEHGVADMRGRSISQRATALIAIADPRFRDELERDARTFGYI